ncbi:hypothetical protein IWW57_002190 [Coemansia sp. S610]|uniref:Uncharacterized protein n=1 Tax=Coemansia linderi TaxID=2663919 RepID=A0ACC1KP98_9FUNG|nr:hypothetical protein LPJ60_005348 [Coemansia sp. RSA 2675]KAJ2028366.1 hypothetical protein IWW57_002190 [Coemansia sp. S610]KAJ2389167.1 hypothetical protein H4S02_002506 [Coemansia sp. RSA 2611]KAJ2792621.1 hypothetical protein GGI18_000259 [Coemansia linderi]
MSFVLRSRIPVRAVFWPRLLPARSALSQRATAQQRRSYVGPPLRQWTKPILYTAGGAALIVLGWPVLRFVVLGGMAYGAYRLLRTVLFFRALGQGATTLNGGPLSDLWRSTLAGLGRSVSPQLVEQLRGAAEGALRVGVESGDRRLVGLVDGGSVGLGEAVRVAESVVVVDGRETVRVEALFPVMVDMRLTPLFVKGVGTAGPGVVVSATVLAKLDSGDVEEIALDLAGSPKKKKHVVDAEYKDL